MANEWKCPACGMETTGDVCEYCGAAKPLDDAEEIKTETPAEEALVEETPLAEDDFDLDAEFAAEVNDVVEEAKVEEKSVVDEGFANGFPNWYLLPPDEMFK